MKVAFVFRHRTFCIKMTLRALLVCLVDLGSDDQKVPVLSDGLFWNPY